MSAPPSTAWTVVSASTCMPAGLAIRSTLSSTTATVPRRAVVDDDDPVGLVDVVVGAGVGDAERRR